MIPIPRGCFPRLRAGPTVFQSKVSFINRDLLLDDFDSEPMNWRMKQDDLQEVVGASSRSRRCYRRRPQVADQHPRFPRVCRRLA